MFRFRLGNPRASGGGRLRGLWLRLRAQARLCLHPKPRRLPPGSGPDSELSSPFTSTPLRSRIANGSATSLLRSAPFRSLKFGDRLDARVARTLARVVFWGTMAQSPHGLNWFVGRCLPQIIRCVFRSGFSAPSSDLSPHRPASSSGGLVVPSEDYSHGPPIGAGFFG